MAAIGVTIGLAAVLAAAPPPTSVVDIAELRSFDAAVSARNYRAASQVYNRAIDARIAARRTGIDPVISEMSARLSMRGDPNLQTLMMIRQAAATAAPERQASLILAEGQVAESIGRLADAERAYRRAAAMEGPAAAPARLALARRLIDHDLAGASVLLDQLAAGTDPDMRWEATLLRSRTLAIGGDPSAAQAKLDASWSLAIAAARPAAAAQRVARDRAIGAPRATQVALASFGPAARSPSGTLRPPPCGGAIGPDDTAIVEIVSQDGATEFNIVRASRPEVAGAFVTAVAESAAPSGQEVVTAALRCSRAIDAIGPRGSADADGAFAAWVAAHGLYAGQLLEADDGIEAVNEARHRLEALRAAYGPDTLEALSTLNMVAYLEVALAVTSGNPVYLSHARADLEDATRIAKAAGAPAIGVATLEIRAAEIPEDIQAPREENAQRVAATLRRMIDWPELSTQALVEPIMAATQNRVLPLADRSAMADRIRAVLAARHVPATDRAMQAATANKLALLQEGRITGVPALASAASFDPGLCQTTDVPPHVINADAIKSEDYPADLTIAAVQGVDSIEFDVDPAGKSVSPRIVFASPPELFDPVTAAGFAKLRFDAARNGGKAVACRAIRQTIRWQLPEQGSAFEKALERMSGR